MTATERLRELLDERGVEWEPVDGCAATFVEHEGDAWRFDYDEYFDRLVIVPFSSYTPEQAIEATLGRGTCQLKPWEMERDTGFYDCMECACGYVADVADWAEWRYCPSCGRKVVDR